jgi:hypothetical protein
MSERDALAELAAMIARREDIIRRMVVSRAIDAALGESLEAANEVEPRLEAAGYEQTIQGDWFLG